MFSGVLSAHEAGQYPANKKLGVAAWKENSYIYMYNQRTFGEQNETKAGFEILMWVGKGGGGCCHNCCCLCLPCSIGMIGGQIPKQMKGVEGREYYYMPYAVHVMPEYDAATKRFKKDEDWKANGTAPADLDNRIVLTFSSCNGKTSIMNGKYGKVGDVCYPMFAEVHAWRSPLADYIKFYIRFSFM